MAGLLYLPRLFVYHSDPKITKETYLTFIKMEKRLYKLETRFEPSGVKVKEKYKRFPRYRKRSSSSYVPSYVNMETFTNELYK